MTQLTLIDPAPAARRRDPSTSHAAANQAGELQARHHKLILDCLKRFGPSGKDRIGKLTGIGGVGTCRRLTELERKNLVRPTGRNVKSDAGRAEREWEAVLA